MTPSSSSDKVYAPLQVATPRTLEHYIAAESLNIRPLQIDEQKNVDKSTTPTTFSHSDGNSKEVVQQKENPPALSGIVTPEVAPQSKSIDRRFSEYARELFGSTNYASATRLPTPGFSQFNQPPEDAVTGPMNPPRLTSDLNPSRGDDESPAEFQIASNEVTFAENTLPNLRVTRQEVLVLSSVLGRIPQTLISGEGVDINQTSALTVVDDLTPTTMITTTSQEDIGESVDTEVVREGNYQGRTRGKLLGASVKGPNTLLLEACSNGTRF